LLPAILYQIYLFIYLFIYGLFNDAISSSHYSEWRKRQDARRNIKKHRT